MSRGRGRNLLGVGGTRSHLSRGQLRAGRNGAGAGSRPDPAARKRELLEKLRFRR